MFQHDLRLFVDRLSGQSRLTLPEQEALLGLPIRVSRVRAQRDIVRLGETVTHISVVVEGVVARFGQNAEGERQITALHIGGDAPDLHLVVVPFGSCPLQALSATTILHISHSALRDVMARYPAIAHAFWRHCSIDAAITAQWVVNLGRRDAKTRLSHLLCEMAVRHDAVVSDGEFTFPFPLTQLHLADATGLTPVHVSRSIKALKEEGFVILSDRTARVYNWERLVDRAEFDANYLHAGHREGHRLETLA